VLVFLCEYIVKCNLFLLLQLIFQHHYSSLQCHVIILIWWSRKHLWKLSMLKTVICILFQIFWWIRKLKRTAFIWN